MAKKKQILSISGFDAEHIRQTEQYIKMIDAIYSSAVSDYAQLAAKLNINPDKIFSFSDYPTAKKKSEEIIKGLSEKVKTVVKNGSENQWLFANKKNDAFLQSIFDTSKIKKTTLSKYQDRNLDALKTFQNRKINGLGLSEKIWNYSNQIRPSMEMGIDLAIGQGLPAKELAKQLQQYLVDPDKLFRRVRDKHGALQLSKKAAEFNSGQGKYRSSYKNALRLTRTEINMSYREADNLRWKQLPFVSGLEVRLSNAHHVYDICDILKGKYPKDFKFVGWHPQCLCHAVPVLLSREEFNTDELDELKAAINGTEYKPFQSPNTITNVPKGFTDWAKDNAERSKGWKSQPYFIRDNFKGGKISGGLKLDTNTEKKASNPVLQQSKIDNIISIFEKSKVEYKEVNLLQKELKESEIIERIGGGDMTKGSCSSLAFAYAGNKYGLDVLDFRDGVSRYIFSKQDTIMEIAKKVGGIVAKSTNDFKKANELLKTVIEGNEYYFSCGSHAAIVRKTNGAFEFLELQSKDSNGFKPITNKVLKQRFAAKQSHSLYGRKYETKDCIIDISLLNNESGFKKLLGYINTSVESQKKGVLGSIK